MGETDLEGKRQSLHAFALLVCSGSSRDLFLQAPSFQAKSSLQICFMDRECLTGAFGSQLLLMKQPFAQVVDLLFTLIALRNESGDVFP